jgi:hypothetical protein
LISILVESQTNISRRNPPGPGTPPKQPWDCMSQALPGLSTFDPTAHLTDRMPEIQPVGDRKNGLCSYQMKGDGIREAADTIRE